jgi:hypothetical protein
MVPICIVYLIRSRRMVAGALSCIVFNLCKKGVVLRKASSAERFPHHLYEVQGGAP